MDDNEMNMVLNIMSGYDKIANSTENLKLLNLVEIFEDIAVKYPDNICIKSLSENLSYTYKEVNLLANKVANYLHENNAHSCAIGMMLPRSASVYISLLGILKAGCAYVPIDPEYPIDRVAYILMDSGAPIFITSTQIQLFAKGFDTSAYGGKYIEFNNIIFNEEIPNSKLAINIQLSDLAYMIYTSGSTGRPKGVMIEHGCASTLINSERKLFAVEPTDIVYQGFSIAFDASVEEVWLAFASGGSLFCASSEMIHAGAGLSKILSSNNISILSTVPTLLSFLDPPKSTLPKLKLLILGGEACSNDLIKNWATFLKGDSGQKRRMVNSYGPTEATVIATAAECGETEYVTIGGPIPYYVAYIMKGNEINPIGVAGELIIGGNAVARGYKNREDLTTAQFVPNLNLEHSLAIPRLYKTGDLCRWDKNGRIEFLGRIDAQVKIRGFRVELSEIESCITQLYPELSIAVCTVSKVEGVSHLIAYLLPSAISKDSEIDEIYLIHPVSPTLINIQYSLSSRLPRYMIPTRIEWIKKVPTLPSGKVDRKKLPPLRVIDVNPKQEEVITIFEDKIEDKIANIWAKMFGTKQIVGATNFFDLGGHSVFVAEFLSILRKDPETASLSMGDVYANPTLQSFSELTKQHILNYKNLHSNNSHKDEDPLVSNEIEILQSKFLHVSPLNYYLCGFGQLLGFLLLLSCLSWFILIPWRLFAFLEDSDYQIFLIILIVYIATLSFFPIFMILTICLKWLLIGRFQPGLYPIWGWYYFRYWLVSCFINAIPVIFLKGSFMLNCWYKCLGMQIGERVHLGTVRLDAYDLISIGDDASLNSDVLLETVRFINGYMVIGSIAIGSRCFVGNRAAIIGGLSPTVMKQEAILGDLSLLTPGSKVSTGEVWSGSPAIKKGAAELVDWELAEEMRPSNMRRFVIGFLQVFFICCIPLIVVSASLPSAAIFYYYQFYFYSKYGFYIYIAFTIPFSTCFLLFLAFEIIALKWCLIGTWTKKQISTGSFYWVRKWMVDVLLQLSMVMLHAVYSSLYIVPYLRLLGAQIGSNTEVSTLQNLSPDQLVLGNGVFIADFAYLGPPTYHLGIMYLDSVIIGDKTFVGNSSLLPGNSVMGSNVLVGVMSTTKNISLRANPSPFPAAGGREQQLIKKLSKLQTIPEAATLYRKKSMYDEIFPENTKEIDELGSQLTNRSIVSIKEFNSSAKAPSKIKSNTNWLGSPSFELPRRMQKIDFGSAATYQPSYWLIVLRLIIEFFRITVPTGVFVFFLIVFMADLTWLGDLASQNELAIFLIWAPIYISLGLSSCIFVIVIKWLFVGRYEPSDIPLYSLHVWVNEFIVSLCESLTDPFVINHLRGTPFLTLWFRFLGSDIGDYVYMNTCQITEFDLLKIDDEAMLSKDSILQTHLFEDRVMKTSSLHIGKYVSLGQLAVVLYDVFIEQGAKVSCLSLIMKGENLPAWTCWQGTPAQKIADKDFLLAISELDKDK